MIDICNYRQVDDKIACDTLLNGKTPVDAVLFDAITNEPIYYYENLSKVSSVDEFKKIRDKLCVSVSRKYVRLAFFKRVNLEK